MVQPSLYTNFGVFEAIRVIFSPRPTTLFLTQQPFCAHRHRPCRRRVLFAFTAAVP